MKLLKCDRLKMEDYWCHYQPKEEQSRAMATLKGKSINTNMKLQNHLTKSSNYNFKFVTIKNASPEISNWILDQKEKGPTQQQQLCNPKITNSFWYQSQRRWPKRGKTEAETVEHFHFGQIEFARVHMGMQTNCTLKTLMKSTKFRHSSTVGWSLFLKKEMNH